MIKSNGGVFGRNPTFNDVTVDGNLTVNGDIALGDDIVVADSLTVQGTTASTSTTTGALTVAGGVGIQGAVHTGSDLFVNASRIRIGNGASAGTNVAFGEAALRGTAAGSQNVAIGDFALAASGTAFTGFSNVVVGQASGNLVGSANRNTLVGRSAGNAVGATAQTYSDTVGVGNLALSRNQANDVVAIGSEALDINTLGTANVAVGRSALGAATTAIATVTTTVAGTGGTDGANTAIQLERDSGGTMVTYPTVDLTVSGGAVSGTVTVATGGSGSTSNTAGGIIFRANAAGIAAGVPADWRCQLATVSTASSNTAVGHQAGLTLTTASNCTFVGSGCGDAVTTGASNTAMGTGCLGAVTTGAQNVGMGHQCLENLGTGATNTSIGFSAGRYHIGSLAVIIGGQAGANLGFGVTATSGFIFIGASAGRRFGSGSDSLLQATNSILIGNDVRANADNQTNEIAIGASLVGDGSNTVSIGTTATTQSRLRGGTFLSTGANGQSTQLGQSTTLLSGLTGATVTATNLIPANSILLGVTARVTTAITGATTFDIGDGVTADRFGNDVAIALNTTSNQVIAPAAFAAANNVVLTANGSNFTGGAVRLTAHFMTLVAPTS